MSRPLLALLLGLAACRGTPAGEAPADAAGLDTGPAGPAVRLLWSRPFGPEGEVPAALLAAGPERLVALTDRALYFLDHEGRVLSRAPLPEAAAGAGGVSDLEWDGSGLGLALRWRGDAAQEPGTYLGLTEGEGGPAAPGLTPIAPLSSPVRCAWDGGAHVCLWLGEGAGLTLEETRVPRDGSASTRTLETDLAPGLALGELTASNATRELCTLEADGGVKLRRFAAAGRSALSLGAADRQALGPCRLASSGRTRLVSWKQRALATRWPDGGSLDGRLRALSFDEPVARLASGELALPGQPLRLSAIEGTLRVEASVWDGSRYLVLLDAAGLRGGRLFLAIVDEAGQLLARDLAIPIEVEPAQLLPAALVVGADSYLLLYGLRRPWDEGLLYLARFRLEAASGDGR